MYDCLQIVGLGTPLHAAARGGCASIAELLLREGADVSIGDSCGEATVQVAEAAGNVEVVRGLRDFDDMTKFQWYRTYDTSLVSPATCFELGG
jgi:hypothetical protein